MSVLDAFKLTDKTAVVTGSGRGIGRGIALALAEAGANVVVSARRQDDIDAVAKEVEGLGQQALAIAADVTSSEDMDRLAQGAVDKFGTIDIWVNNAGGLPDGTPRYLTKTSEDKFAGQINLNLNAVWLGCVTAAQHMSENGGAIINISSRASHGPQIKNGPYGASKAAVNSLTSTFSVELAPKIRVNAVAPGPIVTDNFRDSMNIQDGEYEEKLRKMINIPLERYGEPEDIGAAVVYFASPASAWVTGQVLFVTGGL